MSDDDDNAEKRAHHNALERKRRDHIKDSFSSLKDAVPTLRGEKTASRAQILKKAAEYILSMRKKTATHQQGIADLKRQNSLLEAQIRQLERTRSMIMANGGTYPQQLPISERYIQGLQLDSLSDSTSSDTSDDDSEHRSKKRKVNELC